MTVMCVLTLQLMCAIEHEQHSPKLAALERAVFFQFLLIALQTIEDPVKEEFIGRQ